MSPCPVLLCQGLLQDGARCPAACPVLGAGLLQEHGVPRWDLVAGWLGTVPGTSPLVGPG